MGLVYPLYPKNHSQKKIHHPINRFGKESKRWYEAKKVLKVAFSDCGIMKCELDIPHKCNGWQFLTWAHGDKRRNLTKEELYFLVVLCCLNGHQIIERMPRLEMRQIVERIINNRMSNLIEVIKKLGVITEGGNFIWY